MQPAKDIAIPTIWLNGTSEERLLDDLANARTAITAAIDALCVTAPNSRDYYPQGPAAYEKARHAHILRVEALHKLKQELVEIAEGIIFR